jgi:hypothetical protein
MGPQFPPDSPVSEHPLVIEAEAIVRQARLRELTEYATALDRIRAQAGHVRTQAYDLLRLAEDEGDAEWIVYCRGQLQRARLTYVEILKAHIKLAEAVHGTTSPGPHR